MRRIVTWLVVAAVAGLALAATVDGLVGPRESAPRAAPRTTTAPLLARQPELAVSQLREAGLTGVLTFSDEECRLHAVSLPELEPVEAPSFEMCRPLTSTGGIGAVDGEVVWSGLGYGTVQVVLSEERLSRAIRVGLGIPAGDVSAGFRAVQAVSLDGERYVVLADSTYSPRERVLAVFEGRRARFVHPRWLVGDARAVRPSPRGGYYALLGPGVVAGDGSPIFSRDGRQQGRPEGIPHPRAIAWSPDERWTALATDESVYVYPTRRPGELVVRIPLAVRDLDWSD
ncbi:MAG TPA: hypothetical protein VFR63_09720 [Gaiellaceae bacterium]|nr:hypothetical protein [Gaiellaceae bacterium]